MWPSGFHSNLEGTSLSSLLRTRRQLMGYELLASVKIILDEVIGVPRKWRHSTAVKKPVLRDGKF